MSPRQIFAYLALGFDRECEEKMQEMNIAMLAARGTAEEIDKTLEDLT